MKIGLSTKLIAGFLGVALITLAVGVVGYSGLNQLNKSMDLIIDESIPTITDLETALVRIEILKGGLRSLTTPYMTEEWIVNT